MQTNVSEPAVKADLTVKGGASTQASTEPDASLWARLKLRGQITGYRVFCYLMNHMLLFKLFFAVLRRMRPLALIGTTLWVTKADDIREVMSRFDDFLLGESIEPGMPWGQFMMTIDWREQHALERAMLQSVVNPAADVRTLHAIAADECRKQAGLASGRIDVVAGIAEPVAVRIAAEYFGVPPLGGSAHRMADAMADLSGLVLLQPPVNSQPWASSREHIAGVTKAILARIAERKAAIAKGDAGLPDDLLTRLVRKLGDNNLPPWFGEDWVRRYLSGLMSTGGATIVRAAAHAIDQLLEHPEGLQQAKAVAAQLDQAPGDPKLTAQLRQLIYEALRQRPMLPMMVRTCPRDTVVAAGTKRARVVPGGSHVILAALGAMLDPETVESPGEFRAGRPDDVYLLFGYGLRECFGRYVAESALIEIIRCVVQLPGLARAPGSAGNITYVGVAPRSLTVTFTAPGARSAA